MLEEVVEQKDLKRKIDQSRLSQEWKEIVGDSFADHLSVASLENGNLTLVASDPSWSQEASLQKESIKETINDYFGYRMISSIRITN